MLWKQQGWKMQSKQNNWLKHNIMSLCCVPSLPAISSLGPSGFCVFVWDMDRVTTHSAPSSVVRPLLTDSEQIDLGVDYSGSIFHNFWLATSHFCCEALHPRPADLKEARGRWGSRQPFSSGSRWKCPGVTERQRYEDREDLLLTESFFSLRTKANSRIRLFLPSELMRFMFFSVP